MAAPVDPANPFSITIHCLSGGSCGAEMSLEWFKNNPKKICASDTCQVDNPGRPTTLDYPSYLDGSGDSGPRALACSESFRARDTVNVTQVDLSLWSGPVYPRDRLYIYHPRVVPHPDSYQPIPKCGYVSDLSQYRSDRGSKIVIQLLRYRQCGPAGCGLAPEDRPAEWTEFHIYCGHYRGDGSLETQRETGIAVPHYMEPGFVIGDRGVSSLVQEWRYTPAVRPEELFFFPLVYMDPGKRYFIQVHQNDLG